MPPDADAAFPAPLAPPADSFPTVPGYDILGELGRGGMGVVYKARQVQLDRVVALKVITRDLLLSPDAVRRFCREMRAAARLSHPGIITVYDAGLAAGLPFFTMEYVEGVDLAALVRRDGPLAVERACEYVRQAALGLQHALDRGLVHRDVKPANLFVSAAGDVVKVLDLGLARLLRQQEETPPSLLTPAGAVLGTPDFAAPEQLLSPHTADTRADLYSLGCTLYFLLTGQVPFPGGTVAAKVAGHLSDTPPAAEGQRPGLPPAVAAVLRKLMAKRPEDRYQTPAELASVLAALARTGWRAPRRPWLAAGVGLAAVVAAVLGAGVWKSVSPGEEEGGRAGPPAEVPGVTRPAEGPDQAVAALGKLGATVAVDEKTPGKPVTEVDLLGSKAADADLSHLRALADLEKVGLPRGATDAGLSHLRGLRRLRWLHLGGAPITDAGLRHLTGLEGLTWLWLGDTKVGDAGLEHLRGLPNLRTLSLVGTEVGDAGLQHVGKMSQLTFLGLGRTRVTDRGLKHLQGLHQLWGLELQHTAVTNAGLPALAGLPQLRQLELVGTKVSDAGLAELKGFPQLQHLDLSEAPITDEGLKHLRDLAQLQSLDLTGTQVTATGVEGLHKALPKASIKR